MKNKVNQILAIFLLLFSTYAFSNVIKEINFIGLNTTQQKLLLSDVDLKVGDEYSDLTSNAIIQSLFKTGLFSDISITNNQGSIDIALVENPTIKYFEFILESDSSFSNWLKNEKMLISIEMLEIELDNNNLSAGNPFTQTQLDEFVLKLKSKYSESGYFNVAIDQNISIDSQNRAGIELIIQKGKRVKIDKFTISGADKLTEETLLKLFEIGEADMALINYFTNNDLFTDEEFAQGIDLMTNTYFDLGYLDFKILNIDSELNPAKDQISLNIDISEGIQYKLGKLDFDTDIEVFSKEVLLQEITMNEGEIFNRSSIIKNIESLTDKFADQGFAFVDINPVVTDYLDTVNVKFIISLNSKTYINRITISGNTRTQDSVIRREIGVSEGGLYSRSELKKSIGNIRRLGYFSDVQISTSEVANMPDKIDINFAVEETQTGAISFSVSHSNNYGVSFGAGIKERNIFGSGNTLNAELNLSESYNRISFYFMNPNYNDEGHSVSFGVFRSEINDDDIAASSYEINTTGANFGYGIPLSDNTRINSDFEYSQNEIKCSSLFSGSSYESEQCATKDSDEFKLNINWSKNTLDDYL